MAKKKLDRGLKELTKAGDKNPGRLKVAEEAVARSQALVERGEMNERSNIKVQSSIKTQISK